MAGPRRCCDRGARRAPARHPRRRPLVCRRGAPPGPSSGVRRCAPLGGRRGLPAQAARDLRGDRRVDRRPAQATSGHRPRRHPGEE
eukprot:1266494-Alexandrium_andersonii.AAC.1